MASNEPETSTKEYLRTATNICRLCGDAKDYARSTLIFGKVGRKKKLAELIKNTLGIVINEEEALSSKVCRKCQDLLKKSDDFKTMELNIQETTLSEGPTKRCFKSPLSAEPGKRGRADGSVIRDLRPRLGTTSKRLDFSSDNSADGTGAHEQPTLGDLGINNKPVSVKCMGSNKDLVHPALTLGLKT